MSESSSLIRWRRGYDWYSRDDLALHNYNSQGTAHALRQSPHLGRQREKMSNVSKALGSSLGRRICCSRKALALSNSSLCMCLGRDGGDEHGWMGGGRLWRETSE